MELKLYNTLTRRKEVFRPMDEKNVRLYVCGPTVYDTAHIGNARTFLTFDLLFRVLRHLYGPEHVTYVRNITDIDDKINARAAERFPDVPTNEAIRRLTEETNTRFQADMTALGLLPPTHQPRATEHVQGMIAMISGLVQKGRAYGADGHVLFDVAAAEGYGTLSRRTIDDMIAGARVDVAPYKKGPMDFVLWKPSGADQPGWESPWGRGRPGWHIECSVMSRAFLGEEFDIHGGGIDLVFPHHENERAQSLAAHGCEMSHVWMHGGFLQVEDEKMSKSLGNFATAHEVLDKWPVGVVRYAMLMTHYRQPLNWSEQRILEASFELDKLAMLADITDSLGEAVWARACQHGKADSKFVEALCDDLNTHLALQRLQELRLEINSRTEIDETADNMFSEFLNSLELVGLLKPLQNFNSNKEVARAMFLEMNGPLIQKKIALRQAAKKAKNFAEADRIRKELEAQNIQLKDTPTGTTWELKR